MSAEISRVFYEIHLLTRFLLRGSEINCRYSLATNVEKAENFDDVVMKYLYRDESGSQKWKVVLLQAIHRENPKKNMITFKQLISEVEKGQFNLKKYFKSYRKIKHNFSREISDRIFGCHRDVFDIVIYTNALSDFSNINEFVEKLDVERDDILNLSENSGYYYKIISSGESYRRIVNLLEYCSRCKRLARELAKCIFSETNVALNEGLSRDYHVPLVRDVIQKMEIGEKGCLRESFLNGDSELKTALLEEVQKRPELTGKSEDELMSELHSKTFTLSDNFAKGTDVISGKYPENLPKDLVSETEIKEFLERLKFFVEQPGEEKLAEIIKEEIQKTYKVDQEDINSVFSEIRMTMLDWWREGYHYITEENRIFKNSIRISFRFDVKKPVALFAGRNTELKKLHEVLQNGHQSLVPQTASIIGLGGIGKSELARKYINEYYELYDDNVIWIKADNYSTISESFRRLAEERLKISTKDWKGNEKSTKDIVSDVYSFFIERHRKSIFVFDNAGKYNSYGVTNEGIFTFLPSGPYKPHVLITSRNQEWGDIKPLSLAVFSRVESAEFIKSALKNVIDLDDNEVNRLAEATGHLPLALGQAVAYIKVKNSPSNWKSPNFTIENYLKAFEEKSEDLLNQPPIDYQDRYTETVLTTWTTTIEKIEKEIYGELALKIFNMITYLASNKISIEQIFLSSDISEKELHRAVELLDQYSLATLEYGWLDIHPIVQKVTHIHLEKQGQDKYVIQNAWNQLKKCFPNGKTTEDLQTQKIILPHFEALLYNTQNWIHNKPQDLQILGNQIILSLIEYMTIGYNNRDNPKRLKEILEVALKIKEKYAGTDYLKVAETLNNLGSAYGDLGNPKKEIELLERALYIQENHYGTDHYEVAKTLNNLGVAYGDLRNTQKQIKLLERALCIQENHYGTEHYEVAKTLNNLASAYGGIGNPQKQIEMLERALCIQNKHYGTDHYKVAKTLNNLGSAYGGLGNPQKQIELLERALCIQEKHYGTDHYEVAKTLNNLSSAYGDLRNPQKQVKLLELALCIQENHYGTDHYEVAKTLINLGSAYGGIGNPQKQIELLQRALCIQKNYYGNDHFIVSKTLNNLGTAYGDIGNPQKQIELLEKSLCIQEKQLGSDNFEAAKTVTDLAKTYGGLGNLQKQRELLQRALCSKDNLNGIDNDEVTNLQNNLGSEYDGLHSNQKGDKC